MSRIAIFGVTFVDFDGFEGLINLPELSWLRFDYPSEIVSVGQQITVQVLDIDLAGERVSLSLAAAASSQRLGRAAMQSA